MFILWLCAIHMITQSIIDQAILISDEILFMRVSKPKADTLNNVKFSYEHMNASQVVTRISVIRDEQLFAVFSLANSFRYLCQKVITI